MCLLRRARQRGSWPLLGGPVAGAPRVRVGEHEGREQACVPWLLRPHTLVPHTSQHTQGESFPVQRQRAAARGYTHQQTFDLYL